MQKPFPLSGRFFRLLVLMGLMTHLAGCAVFAMVMHGWAGALFLPLFALFGWFLLPVQWVMSFVQWLLFVKYRRSFPWVTTGLALGAAILVAAMGRVESDEGVDVAVAFASAGVASVLVSAFLLWFEYQGNES